MTGLGSDRFLNRELSWLEFNARVLARAEDAGLPLLERVKFLAIFAQNLDEFFQVRVAGLKDQVAAGITRKTPDGRTPTQTLDEIRDQVDKLTARHEQVFLHDVVPALAEEGVKPACGGTNLDDADHRDSSAPSSTSGSSRS